MKGVATGAAIGRYAFELWPEAGRKKAIEMPFGLEESRLIHQVEEIEAGERDFQKRNYLEVESMRRIRT
jgi:hypothetical protein